MEYAIRQIFYEAYRVSVVLWWCMCRRPPYVLLPLLLCEVPSLHVLLPLLLCEMPSLHVPPSPPPPLLMPAIIAPPRSVAPITVRPVTLGTHHTADTFTICLDTLQLYTHFCTFDAGASVMTTIVLVTVALKYDSTL